MGQIFYDKVKEFKRQLIQEQFDQLNERNQQAFIRTYGDIDKINEDDMYKIYCQGWRVLKWKQ